MTQCLFLKGYVLRLRSATEVNRCASTALDKGKELIDVGTSTEVGVICVRNIIARRHRRFSQIKNYPKSHGLTREFGIR